MLVEDACEFFEGIDECSPGTVDDMHITYIGQSVPGITLCQMVQELINVPGITDFADAFINNFNGESLTDGAITQ